MIRSISEYEQRRANSQKLGKAKTMVLIDQVKNALKSTKEPDYVYAISVQGHGKYPDRKVILFQSKSDKGSPTNHRKWQHEYYITNQITRWIHLSRRL